MDDKWGGASFWTFNRPVAALSVGMLAGRVDVAHPDGGLHEIALADYKLGGQLLCVRRQAEFSGTKTPSEDAVPTWPLKIAEAYVRGGDLVANYDPEANWPYSPQIYWRASVLEPADGLLGSLALLVSVQTHLLDTCPQISVSSHLACRETLLVTADGTGHSHAEPLRGSRAIQSSTGVCCVLRRLGNESLSYAELMPASDFREVAILTAESGESHVRWELFADFLEKGVIRRSRLQTAFLQRENDVALAAACCEAIQQRPLPLTT